MDMREHTRANGRYERTEAGTLTLDWGSNGGDYNALDFSYVLKGKMGNLFKIYGQVRRNPDGRTYDTYDIKAGNRRIKTEKNSTVSRAIREHIRVVSGVEVFKLDVKLPLAPDSIKEELSKVILGAIKRWDYLWRGDSKFWSEREKEGARVVFSNVWPCDKFFCEPLDREGAYIPIGILNVDVRENRNLYRLWRESCVAMARKE